MKRKVKEVLHDKDTDAVMEKVEKMTAEQLQALKARIEKFEQGLSADEEAEDAETAEAEAADVKAEETAEEAPEEDK